jgi:nicotinamidase-related amidase
MYGNKISLVLYHLQKSFFLMKALILIDLQHGLTRNRLYEEDAFLVNINFSIKKFRDSNSKIIFIQHTNNQLQIGSFDWEIDNRINKQENDVVIQKKHPNAFQKTKLKQVLLDFKIDSITIAGLVSHGCVKATCLGGLAEGFDISLLKNGHTNWNKDARIKIADTEIELSKKGVKLVLADECFCSH